MHGDFQHAQRRPGFEPRRRLGPGGPVAVAPPIAQRRPGFEPRRRARMPSTSSPAMGAQRRPGFEPRRRLEHARVDRDAEPRSTKAGVRTPATPEHPEPAHLSRGGRSTKAGVRTPATLLDRRPVEDSHLRSTKAGVRTPATPTTESVSVHVTTIAQRRPGFEPRRRPRKISRGTAKPHAAHRYS